LGRDFAFKCGTGMTAPGDSWAAITVYARADPLLEESGSKESQVGERAQKIEFEFLDPAMPATTTPRPW
jgi:hypothetical protein